MQTTQFLTKELLEAGLPHIQNAPKDSGLLSMIVCRPETNERKVLQSGKLDIGLGLLGDNWKTRGSSRTTDGFGHPDMQINIMNVRAISLIAGSKERWKLAGDQLFVDLDLSVDNLPPGTRLSIGKAILEVTWIPHRGCKKFMDRFGKDALRFVNSEVGKKLNLRGINAKVIQSGEIKTGDPVLKMNP